MVPEMNPAVLRNEATMEAYEMEHRGPYSLGALGIYTVVKGRFPGEDDYIVCTGFIIFNLHYVCWDSIPTWRYSIKSTILTV